MQTVLFTKCLQATVPHLLATDVLLHASEQALPTGAFHWLSPFVTSLNATAAKFLEYVSAQPVSNFSTASPAWILAHAPVAAGGLGFVDYAVRAIGSFLVPLAHSI